MFSLKFLLKSLPFLVLFGTRMAAAEPVTPTTTTTLPPKDKFDLFLLAGQSNMAGRGAIDAEGKKPDPHVFKLNQEGHWVPAVDPLHWDKSAAGSGIGKPFAEILVKKYPGISVGLIPAACGGSPISTWIPEASWSQTKSKPYDDALARTKLAMQSGTLKAILWHQGEADSNPKTAPEHEKALRELIQRFRDELKMPNLPFFIGQLGKFPDKPWDANREMVDAAQRQVAKTMPHVYYVSSEGLLSKGDNLHFSTEALRTFGQRYADSYIQNEGGK